MTLQNDINSYSGTLNNFKTSRGFTLVELMIIVVIIGILAAIAYPNYQKYVIKTKRTDMMSEMHNIATQIQSRKLAQGAYSNALTTGLDGNYPRQSNSIYSITITPSPLTAKWTITATPIPGKQMASAADGALSLNYQDLKCRGSKCGMGNEWNE